jgi:putative membrane protein
MNNIVAGAVAGFVATIPMSAAMAVMHALLPKREQYPLPPKEIITSIAEKAGADDDLGEPERSALSLSAHFGYGALTGALYGPLAEKVPLSGAAGGIAYGLFVWAGSYLGLLPATGILAPATEHPARRNALMIAAHVIWGATLGILLERGGKQQ